MTSVREFKSLFLSDFHLGSHNCQALRLYTFLLQHDADKFYLLGDIVDSSSIAGWPEYHDDVVMALVRRGAYAQVVYVPGNHDRLFRKHIGHYGNLQIMLRTTHVCVDGRRLLVTHGDETDFMQLHFPIWLLSRLEKMTGWNAWEWLRRHVTRTIAKHSERFEARMLALAAGYDGVVCGHIHSPRIGARYFNCGDWTHNCTAIAEHHDGRFELLRG
jgi:UDP-2,3-diacylglucosamine pyrophosphatase LpxH